MCFLREKIILVDKNAIKKNKKKICMLKVYYNNIRFFLKILFFNCFVFRDAQGEVFFFYIRVDE